MAGCDLATELLEHQVLVLHLGDELRRLEEALAVAPAGGPGTVPESARSGVAVIMRVDVGGQPVVLGVEDRVDGGQPDVLVAATVTGDEVAVEQGVVVAGRCVGTALCAMSSRNACPVLTTPVVGTGAAGLPSTLHRR